MLQIFPAENQHIHPMCIYPYKASHKGEHHGILFKWGGLWRYCGSVELGIIQVVIRGSFSWRKRMNLTSVAQAALPTDEVNLRLCSHMADLLLTFLLLPIVDTYPYYISPLNT